MLTGRMVPSRANRSLMCLWGLFFGAYIASLSLPSFDSPTFFGAFLASYAISGIVIRYRHGRENPNNAFKPKPLRSTKHMAGKACHVFGSTTQFGLT